MRFPYSFSYCRARTALLLVASVLAVTAPAATLTQHPYPGVTLLTRQETSPRKFTAHILQIDLTTPGLRVKLPPHSGDRETIRQTTFAFLEQEHAQFAINAHFFAPYPSADSSSYLIGLAASDGDIYSEFETPDQSCAIVTDAPAINIDRDNRAAVIRKTDDRPSLWTTVSGSAQILTAGQPTVPVYRDPDHPDGLLTEGGPTTRFTNKDSWYNRPNARTAIAIADSGKTLILFVTDRSPESPGLTLPEVAAMLTADYHADDALNPDGEGSSTLAMEDPATHTIKLANVSADNPKGRSVASNLAVFLSQPKP